MRQLGVGGSLDEDIRASVLFVTEFCGQASSETGRSSNESTNKDGRRSKSRTLNGRDD